MHVCLATYYRILQCRLHKVNVVVSIVIRAIVLNGEKKEK